MDPAVTNADTRFTEEQEVVDKTLHGLSKIPMAILALGLSGCTPSLHTSTSVKAVSSTNLYSAVYRSTSDARPDATVVVDEAIARGLVRPQMRDAVLAGRLELGMTKQEVLCVHFKPFAISPVIRERKREERWLYLHDRSRRNEKTPAYTMYWWLYFADNELVVINN